MGTYIALRPATRSRRRIVVWSSSTHWHTIRERCTSGMTMNSLKKTKAEVVVAVASDREYSSSLILPALNALVLDLNKVVKIGDVIQQAL